MLNANATAAAELAPERLPAFVVNLDARPDRWAEAAQEFARVGWPVRRWSAVRYAQSPNALPVGAAGCLESHRQIWQHALAQHYPVVAVFEDDAVLSGDFKDIFPAVCADLPPQWDVLHLHSFRARTQPVTPRLVRLLSKGWGSHGYLLTAHACRRLLALPPATPVDVQLTQELHKIGGQVYGAALACTLCFQRGTDSDIPGSAQLAYWREQLQRYWRAAPGNVPHAQADVPGSPSAAR